MNTTLNLNPYQLLLIARLLRTRISQLQDMHDAQVQACPPGDLSWADSAENLEIHRSALTTIENAMNRHIELMIFGEPHGSN